MSLAGPSQLGTQAGAAAAAGAGAYTDTHALASLQAQPNSPQALHAVAQQVDALFLQMMLQSMREATAQVGNPQSNELGMYQDMFDKQVALTLSQHQGLGLGAAVTAHLPGAPASAAAPVHASAPATASAPMAQSPAHFVSQVLPVIRQAASRIGVSPLGMLAQAALETNWGQNMPRNADGSPSLNLFGIKAGTGWGGATATASTVEVKDGIAVPQRSTFRAYASVGDSVQDFANLLQGSPRYAGTLAAGNDVQAYAAAIGGSGYATDPEYGNKLSQVASSSTMREALRGRAQVL